MPAKKPLQRARTLARQGKSPSTQAGEFVRDEMAEMHAGESNAKSPQQAIAIGLAKARRSGIDIPPEPRKQARTTKKTASQAKSSSPRKRGSTNSRTPARDQKS